MVCEAGGEFDEICGTTVVGLGDIFLHFFLDEIEEKY